jgi:uncharacterized protein YodC (DUF2158 family)
MENTTEFEIGDLVELRSGSPTMTVSDVEINIVHCQYWNPTAQKFQKADFDFALLRKITPISE